MITANGQDYELKLNVVRLITIPRNPETILRVVWFPSVVLLIYVVRTKIPCNVNRCVLTLKRFVLSPFGKLSRGSFLDSRAPTSSLHFSTCLLHYSLPSHRNFPIYGNLVLLSNGPHKTRLWTHVFVWVRSFKWNQLPRDVLK